MTEFRRLSDRVFAAPQLEAADFPRAAADGFTLVINNRTEGESPAQMSGDEARALAEAAGLAYAEVPVRMATLSHADIDAMAEALRAAPGKVLTYCLSGSRSAALWALAEAKAGADSDTLLAAAANAGFDLEGLRSALENLSAAAKR